VTANKKTVFVLNGPNLNLLGTREPAVYGAATLADVEKLCTDACNRHGFALRFHQSNHEGALVDWIHEAGRLHAAGELAGVVINAGAYTHTSIALHDAIKGTGITLIELHISNVHAREAYRHHSYMAAAAKAVMCGFGVLGYGLAIDGLAQLLAQQPAA
jgi:3-dehydroquinate dehydratase-2